MAKTKIDKLEYIKPLFLPINEANKMGSQIISFVQDDYNKSSGEALIDAKTDAEAISSFLAEFRDSALTLRSYAKEIERLLLWCVHIAKKNISSLRRNDLMEYQDFLKTPEPQAVWCGPKVARQLKNGDYNLLWRPFCQGLSGGTVNKTLTILDSFFNYLVQTNYLTGNPLAVDRRRKKRNKNKSKMVERYLELDEIHAALDALMEYPSKEVAGDFKVLRARYIILLLYYTGLRIAEAGEHTMGDFKQRADNWFLRVMGKGKKLREIPIPDELLEALAEFRMAIGLPSPEPKFREKTPLIPMQNLTVAITPRRIDQILKWAFNLGAARFDVHQPHKASKLRAASAHWLRHSYVTYLLESGVSLKVAQENAGHSDISTTLLYQHVAQTNRHEATKGLSLQKKSVKEREPEK